MVREADVVVIGSGGLGAATAYFLMRRGGRRVALVDRHALASQTSPRAAGNAAMLRSSDVMSRLARRAVEWLLRFTADGRPSEDLGDMSIARFGPEWRDEQRLRRAAAWEYWHFYSYDAPGA
jgi:4-methylaminobutanoate oxidase (formaldehyde-forming)